MTLTLVPEPEPYVYVRAHFTSDAAQRAIPGYDFHTASVILAELRRCYDHEAIDMLSYRICADQLLLRLRAAMDEEGSPSVKVAGLVCSECDFPYPCPAHVDAGARAPQLRAVE